MSSSNILKVGQALEKQLRKQTYNLSSSFLKEFNNRSGFIPFSAAPSKEYPSSTPLQGCALIDTTIEPPIRILSYDHPTFDQSYIKHSIKDALEYREKMSKLGKLDISGKAAYRLINEGGDGLPGLTVDVFGDYLQITTHSEYWCPHLNYITDYIMAETGKKGVYWKAKFKHKTPFAKHYKGDKVTRSSNGMSDLVVQENGMLVSIDLEDVISTGLFMDQRANRQYITSLFANRSSGTILNTFAHTCTFSLAPAINGTKISTYNIDTSARYLNIATHNFKLNDVPLNHHQFVEKDVFGKLADMKDKSLKFDVIVLDPPTLARGPSFGVFTTKNRYRDLLELAIPKLSDGGFIVSFVNTRQLREDAWLRQLGVEDHLEGVVSTSGGRQDEEISEEEAEAIKAVKSLNIAEAKFSSATKIAKHTSNVLPFVKLKGFKKLQALEQDVDFRYKIGDERVGKHLKGVVLKHKVDFFKSKYVTPPSKSRGKGNNSTRK
eukprot:gene6271-7276_t